VDRALAHFPRIVGLREGRLVFDLPPGEVTPERLAHLYAQHEHELVGPGLAAPGLAADDAAAAPAPVVMHCR
jgi:phosphonate transport system ATP-binding protein